MNPKTHYGPETHYGPPDDPFEPLDSMPLPELYKELEWAKARDDLFNPRSWHLGFRPANQVEIEAIEAAISEAEDVLRAELQALPTAKLPAFEDDRQAIVEEIIEERAE
jgi:hypothetical protein